MSKTKIKVHEGYACGKEPLAYRARKDMILFCLYKRGEKIDELVTLLEIRGKHLTNQELEQIKKVVK